MTSDLAALLSSLVAVDSVNPSLVAGGAGEAEIAGFIEAWARDAGLETERLEGTPGRPSVIVRARGARVAVAPSCCAGTPTPSTSRA